MKWNGLLLFIDNIIKYLINDIYSRDIYILQNGIESSEIEKLLLLIFYFIDGLVGYIIYVSII